MSANSGTFVTAHSAANNAYTNWVNLMKAILWKGQDVEVRGKRTKELVGVQWHVTDARNCVLWHPARKANYRFMVAEWVWILYGKNDLDFLLRYNPVYGQFSDDGVTLAGAYGPRVLPQMRYVINSITGDQLTRQAVTGIWTPNPAPSKDIPCTLSLQFLVRGGKLGMIVTMRSSDAWLGIPYDVFSFAMMQNALASRLELEVGDILFNLGSSHLYEEHWEKAHEITATSSKGDFVRMPLVDSTEAQFDRLVGEEPLTGFWEYVRQVLVQCDGSSMAFQKLRMMEKELNRD